MSTIDKEFFAKAAAEVAGGKLDNALYIKSVAISQGDEAKARALYISMRAEEMQRAHQRKERINTTNQVIGTANGLTRLLVRVFFSLCSFFVPGAGQLFSGRHRDAAKFFAPVLVYFVLIYPLHFFVDTAAIPIYVTVVVGVLWISFQLWAAVDAFLHFGKSKSSASSGVSVIKEHAA